MDSFAQGINIYKLVWVFAIGCMLGYVAEMLWCYLKHGYFESRKGVIYGPISPVYGFGAVILTLTLNPIANVNGIFIFLACAVIGALFEYICSLFQEKVFGTISWEYSHTPLNLNGRTNASFAVCWGFLGLIFIRNTYPYISGFIENIPNHIGIPLTWCIAAFFLWDLIISSLAVNRQRQRRENIEINNSLTRFLDNHYPDERLEKIYANMQVVKKAPKIGLQKEAI